MGCSLITNSCSCAYYMDWLELIWKFFFSNLLGQGILFYLFFCIHRITFSILHSKCYQGETNNEKLLGLLVFVLEVLPQLLLLASVLMHWHAPKKSLAIELFGTAVNVPLRFRVNMILSIPRNHDVPLKCSLYFCPF